MMAGILFNIALVMIGSVWRLGCGMDMVRFERLAVLNGLWSLTSMWCLIHEDWLNRVAGLCLVAGQLVSGGV